MSHGTMEVLMQQTSICPSVEMGMLIFSWGQGFSYIRESYKLLKSVEFVVVGDHIILRGLCCDYFLECGCTD